MSSVRPTSRCPRQKVAPVVRNCQPETGVEYSHVRDRLRVAPHSLHAQMDTNITQTKTNIPRTRRATRSSVYRGRRAGRGVLDRSGLEKVKTALVVARRTCLVRQSTPKTNLTKWLTSSMEKEERGSRLGQALGVGVVGDQKGTKAENPAVASRCGIYINVFESVVGVLRDNSRFFHNSSSSQQSVTTRKFPNHWLSISWLPACVMESKPYACNIFALKCGGSIFGLPLGLLCVPSCLAQACV